jgi:hypothetical protein
MKAQLPSAATMALFMTSVLFATWLGLLGPISISAIKEWQTLIGFAGTLTVGAIAWVNVSRQLQQQKIGTRLSLLSREEDRIEKELPGLSLFNRDNDCVAGRMDGAKRYPSNPNPV